MFWHMCRAQVAKVLSARLACSEHHVILVYHNCCLQQDVISLTAQ